MTVRVLLFAGLRERLRRSHVDLELAADATVRDLLSALGAAHPTVRELLPACRVAVDQTFVTADHPVHASSEVAVIPPVSGGHGPVADDSFYLGPSPLAPARAVASVERRSAGGVVTFIGKVREHSLRKVPLLLAVGGREQAEQSVSLRRLGAPAQNTLSLDDAIVLCQRESAPPDL